MTFWCPVDIADAQVKVPACRWHYGHVHRGAAAVLIACWKRQRRLVQKDVAEDAAHLQRAVGRRHAEVFDHDFNRRRFAEVDETGRTDRNQVHIVKGADVGGHLWVADHHAHPSGVQVGSGVTFGQIVA